MMPTLAEIVGLFGPSVRILYDRSLPVRDVKTGAEIHCMLIRETLHCSPGLYERIRDAAKLTSPGSSDAN